MHSCSKLFISNVSKPYMSSTPTEEREGAEGDRVSLMTDTSHLNSCPYRNFANPSLQLMASLCERDLVTLSREVAMCRCSIPWESRSGGTPHRLAQLISGREVSYKQSVTAVGERAGI